MYLPLTNLYETILKTWLFALRQQAITSPIRTTYYGELVLLNSKVQMICAM
jgi:hypothetical protein